jgi:hypothetical protein
MKSYAEYQLELVKQRRAQEIRQAAEARQFARSDKQIRRVVGRSIVRIGQRLAGEQSLELARFR